MLRVAGLPLIERHGSSPVFGLEQGGPDRQGETLENGDDVLRPRVPFSYLENHWSTAKRLRLGLFSSLKRYVPVYV
jgi:hypothetical protein